MKKKTANIYGFVFLALSIAFSLLINLVDVGVSKEIPDYYIGFSTVNNAFHSLTGVNMLYYDITDIMGIISIGFGLIFGFVGFLQLINRKSFFKIDRYIYCLGGTYALLGILYVGFEKIAINYRPIIMEGETVPEASFPSSHTLLICVIVATAIIQINRLFADKKGVRIALSVFGILYITIAVILRLFSGVHWLTDIIAGLFISTSIAFFYYSLSITDKEKHSKKQ